VGRLYGQKLGETLGQPVVVENKSGANGNIAAQFVAKSAADGYTLLLHSSSFLYNAAMYAAPGYDPFADFAPISQLFDYKLVLVAHPSVPVRSLRELVELAKAKPGTISYASAGGAGAPTHLAVELFKRRAGIDLLHVPYQGGAPATNDLLAGHVNIMFNNPTQSLPYVKSGQLRGLAVTGIDRNPLAPDLPTVAESGYPGFDVGTWYALYAPTGVSPDIVRALSAAVRKIGAMPEVLERLAANGLRSTVGSPEELAAFMRADSETMGAIIREQKIRID
jgi:tripartite-type tricarboxylate transporter receptor subunit TctC